MSISGKYKLEKFPGKGGWTFVRLPEFKPDKKAPFGWLKVKGRIDEHQLNHYKLMPMGDGHLFLPVKKSIRKVIGKEAGDEVWIELSEDKRPYAPPPYLKECLDMEKASIQKSFEDLEENEQKAFVDWIECAKKEETKAGRIAEMMRKLELGLKFHQK